jgi:hypothetical protein
MNLTDKAWEKLFDRYEILKHIQRKGIYEIEAKKIREVREPRLMAKFDHYSNLPSLFKEHNLSILPISRSSYIIGQFEVYEKVKYNSNLKPIQVDFPKEITTIDPTNLYSESSALHCAHVTGMIDDILGEKAFQTISGRMSSKEFDFAINTKNGINRIINIRNSQVEIDGGYESASQFMIVEAKNEKVDDFLVRQLFYPYRLWKDKTFKNIKPVFFTYSNDIFSFFIYEFSDPMSYNSLRLKEQKDYIIAHEDIRFEDLIDLLEKTPVVKEPYVPFPQADSFPRIVDLLGLLMENDLTAEQITRNYNFDERQTSYYTSAGIYLGLIEKGSVADERGTQYQLSSKAKKMMKQSTKRKFLFLASQILAHDVFRQTFIECVKKGYAPEKDRIIDIMMDCNLYNVNSYSTYRRRASTVSSWINWILDLPNTY